jgi:glycerol-3-phosphate responsive antiterminator
MDPSQSTSSWSDKFAKQGEELKRSKAKTAKMEADMMAKIDKIQSGIISRVIKEVFNKLHLLILAGGVLTGTWMVLGPTATMILAHGILLVGYIEWRITSEQKVLSIN